MGDWLPSLILVSPGLFICKAELPAIPAQPCARWIDVVTVLNISYQAGQLEGTQLITGRIVSWALDYLLYHELLFPLIILEASSILIPALCCGQCCAHVVAIKPKPKLGPDTVYFFSWLAIDPPQVCLMLSSGFSSSGGGQREARQPWILLSARTCSQSRED